MAWTVSTDLVIIVPAILFTTWKGASLGNKLVVDGTRTEGHPCVCNVQSTRPCSFTRDRPSCGLVDPIQALPLSLSLFSGSLALERLKGVRRATASSTSPFSPSALAVPWTPHLAEYHLNPANTTQAASSTTDSTTGPVSPASPRFPAVRVLRFRGIFHDANLFHAKRASLRGFRHAAKHAA